MTTEVRRAVAAAVATELARQGRDATWLAARSGVPSRDLEQKLGLKRDFTITDLSAIAAALDIEVARLVPPTHRRDR